jgi:hypothetical protein
MAGRPPIGKVPRVVVCRACRERVWTSTSWRPGTPACRRVSCASPRGLQLLLLPLKGKRDDPREALLLQLLVGKDRLCHRRCSPVLLWDQVLARRGFAVVAVALGLVVLRVVHGREDKSRDCLCRG